MNRLLACFGFNKGAPETTVEAPVETDTEGASEEDPGAEDTRALRKCQRCGRFFYHPMRASDVQHLEYCGRYHPGALIPTTYLSKGWGTSLRGRY